VVALTSEPDFRNGTRAVLSAARRRPVLAAALLYAALALIFIGQALVPGRALSNSDSLYFTPPWSASRPADLQRPSQIGDEQDWAVAYEPWLRYNRAEFPGIPLWNPYVMAGRPYVGSASQAVFSVFSLPVYVLPFDLANGLVAALKLFFAALGTFLVGRFMRIAWAGALLAGLVFAFGMPLVTWLMEINVSAVWALYPWLLLATSAVATRRGLLPVYGLAATSAAVFVGAHPESVAQTFAGATAFLALLVSRKPDDACRRGLDWAGSVGRFVVGVLWGAALAAVAIVPFIEMVAHSSDIAERGIALHRELPPRFLRTLMLPDYFGRGTGILIDAEQLGRFLYVGALPLILASAALLRPRVERVACGVFAVACVAVAFGAFPFADLANVLPGLSRTDNTRLIIIGLPAVALLAGWGLDDLCEAMRDRPRTAALLSIGAFLLCLPLVWVVGEVSTSHLREALRVAWFMATPPASPEVVRLASLILWLTVAGAAVILVGLRVRGRIAAAVFTPLAVILVVVDLFRIGMGFNPAIPSDRASQPATGVIRYLQSRRPARYVALGFLNSVMPSNVALRYRLYDARGYDFPIERRYRRLWGAVVNPDQQDFLGFSAPLYLTNITPASLRALSLFGVADIMVAPDSPPLGSKDLSLAYRGADAKVYTNDRTLPRVFVVSGQRKVGGEDAAFAAVTSPSFDARREVVREGMRASTPTRGPSGRARLLSYEPNRVVVAASASRPSTVVLSDIWFPGWKATVDGKSAEVERVDYLLRGVRVGPGAHRVVFSYRPGSWRIAWIITLIASVSFVVTLILVIRGCRLSPSRGAAG
jgi:Bacterial membrane protein YfhO